MATVADYFEHAQLSMAAYAVGLQEGMFGGGEGSPYHTALVGAGMSSSQATKFANTYTVIAQSPDTGFFGNGFSATVFENNDTGAITIAIRGTELPSGFINDLLGTDIGDIGFDGIAVSQGIALYNWLQRLYGAPGEDVVQYSYVVEADEITGEVSRRLTTSTAAATSELYLQTAPVTATGHSLGGHLAMVLSRLAPDLIGGVVTFNAPGFDSAAGLNPLTSDGFFDLLRNAFTPTPPITGEIGIAFDDNLMNHVDVEGDFVHSIGNTPGIQQYAFSEDMKEGIVKAHSINPITDALALYDLFGRLDPTLNGAALSLPVSDVLQASASDATKSLENVLDAVRRILLGSTVKPTPYGEEGRNQFYEHYFALVSRDANSAESVAFDALAGNAVLLSLVSESQAALQTLSETTDANGLAYRYALQALNPFALLGADYSLHNADGALALYEPAARSGTLTRAWLEDRAAFLVNKILASTTDSQVFGKDFVQTSGATQYFEDRSTGVRYSLYRGLASFVVRDPIIGMSQFLFGGSGPDNLTGGNFSDHLYAAAGNDFLQGGEGDDYLEGGFGEDIYHYRAGDGLDDILDIDGRGRILYADAEGNQRILTGGRQLSAGGSLYQSSTDSTLQYRLETEGTLTIAIDGADAIRVLNYEPGDLGISLEDLSGSLLAALNPSRPPEEWETLIQGDQDSSALDDDIEADPITEVIQGGTGDDVLSGRSGQQGYVQDVQIYGGDGADVIYGEFHYASRYYEIGAEAFEAEQGELQPGLGVHAFGEAGNDRFLGSLRDDTFDGGADHDFANGYVGDDLLVGGTGNDLLNGDEGGDEIRGGSGGDLLAGGAGSDVLRGGDGNDQIYGDSTYAPLAWDGTNLILLYGTLGTGRFAVVRDVAQADAGDDVLEGGAGDDELYGGAGNDLLDGGADNDRIQGEGGDDFILGGDGDDRIFGDWSVDAEGNDEALLDGDHGTYTYHWRSRDVGDEGDDYVDAGTGDDMVWGGGGDDYLSGGAGNDTLIGGLDDGSVSGDDILDGGAGADVLRGEDGNDTYIFARGYGSDFAEDSGGVDRVVFLDGVASDDIDLQIGSTDALNLVLQIAGTEDRLTLHDWFDPTAQIESVEFADGTVWDDDYLLARLMPITAAGSFEDTNGVDTIYDAFLGSNVGEGFELSLADRGGWDSLSFNRTFVAESPLGPVFLRPQFASLVQDGNDLLLDLELISGIGDTDIHGSARLIDYFGRGRIEHIVIDGREFVPPEIVGEVAGTYLLTSASEPLLERFNVNYSYSGISSVTYSGTDAADTLSADSRFSGLRSTYYGNGGDDLLVGSTGSDTFIGGSGADRMEGGRGSDSYHVDPAEQDVVIDNEFGYSVSSSDSLVLPAGLALADIAFRRQGDDLLIGETHIERYFERDIDGLGFDDYPFKIERLEGDGFVIEDLAGYLVDLGLFGSYTGTSGGDTLNGDQLDNTIHGGDGADLIRGSGGNDRIVAGAGDDTAYGEGTFRSYGDSTYDDEIDGGAGNDFLQGDRGSDTLLGGEGNDVLYGDEGHAELPEWTLGLIFIDYGRDTLAGGSGNDVLYGEQDGDTYLFGRGDGVDVIQDWGYDRWNDERTLFGGSIIRIEAEIAQLAYFQGETYRSHEWAVLPREFRDLGRAMGEDLARVLDDLDEGVTPTTALALLTQLRDWFVQDQLDIVVFGEGITPEDLTVEVLPGELQIDAGGGDVLFIRDPDGGSNYGIERFRFADGQELTLVEVMALDENVGHDMELEGTVGSNVLAGGNGDDYLDGRGGSDVLIGGAGDDVLYGGYQEANEFIDIRPHNADVLDGGPGNDFMDGEDGADTYIVRLGDGIDEIDDSGASYDTTRIDSDLANLATSDGTIYANGYWWDELMDQWGAFPISAELASGVAVLEQGVAPDVALQTLSDLREWFIAQETDVVEFGEGITPESITIKWNEYGGFLIGTGPGEGVVVYGVECFRFAGGQEVSAAQLRALGEMVSDDFGSIYGTEGADILVGEFIDDYIRGYEGDDLLIGNGGDDELNGGDGDDVLVGGAGSRWGDYAEGGAGSDVYLFNRGDIIANSNIIEEYNVDVIYDYGRDPTAADIDTISFGADIRPGDIDAFIDAYDGGDYRYATLGLVLHETRQAILVEWSYEEGDWAESYAIERMQFLGGGDERVFDLAGLIEARYEELAQASENTPLPLFTPKARAAFELTGEAAFAGGQYARNYAYTGDVFTPPPNTAPVVAQPLADLVVDQDAVLDFAIPADAFIDADGDELVLAASASNGAALPPWLAFDAANRRFSGTPGNDDVGEQTVRVTATDSVGASVFDDFLLSVANVNDAPVLVSALEDVETKEDEPFAIEIPSDTFADIDAIHGDVLAYAVRLADGGVLPTWLAFDDATRSLSGTPGNDDVGTIEIELVGTDQAGASASTVFRLEVSNANDAPVVAAPLADQSVQQDEAFTLTVADAFLDVDEIHGDTLAYAATLADGAALPHWLTIESVSGVLAGTPGNDDVGQSTITVSATDTAGASISQAFTLMVENVNDAPVLAVPMSSQSVKEYDLFAYELPQDTFLEPDLIHGDLLSYAATLADGSALPDWLTFDADVRTFTGTPSLAERGEYAIRVQATDAAGVSASGTFNLSVLAAGNGIAGGTGTDALTGTSGDDVIAAGPGLDVLLGNGGNDILDGGEGSDVLLGGSGDDRLLGGAGDDLLYGGSGDNVLHGGAGNDLLVGGNGADRYVFNRGDGRDSVLALAPGTGADTIEVGAEPIEILFARARGGLQVGFQGSDDQLHVTAWNSRLNQVETIVARDGSAILSNQVEQLIQAMNQFSAGNGGISWEQAIADRPQDVEAVLAAYWQPAAA